MSRRVSQMILPFDVTTSMEASMASSARCRSTFGDDGARRLRRCVSQAKRSSSVALSALIATLVVAAMAVGAAPAMAGPVLDVTSSANTTAAPGGTIDYFLSISDVGDTVTDGSPLRLQVTLPLGLTLLPTANPDCSTFVPGATTGTCVFNNILDPNSGSRTSTLTVSVAVDPSATGTLVSTFAVSGGGAPAAASTVDTTRVSATPPGFGIDSFDAEVTADRAGHPFTQAGGHPYAATTSILFNTFTNSNPYLGPIWPAEPVKDITVNLPAGFSVNPTATGAARCTAAQLAAGTFNGGILCPPGSQVGTTSIFTPNGVVLGPSLPVYIMVPPAGVPARLAFNAAGSIVTLDGKVRTGSDYGLTATVHDASEGIAVAGTTLTLWGVPADPSHDVERSCPGGQPVVSGGPTCTTDAPRRPFLRNPTSCTAPGVGLETTMSADSWFHPGVPDTAKSISHVLPGFPAPPSDWGAQQGTTGCDLVPFSPSFNGAPDLAAAGSPAAFSVDLSLPQSDNPDAIGTSDLRTATVTLPAGMKTSAAVADGLTGCSPTQIALKSESDATCPEASKIGSVTIDTPLLDEPLTGSVYLASPHDNPFDSLLAFYIVANGPGVVVKLPARVDADPVTGQLTTTLTDQPQLPFSKVHLELKGGPRAPLANPPVCGTYTTHAVLTSWSGKTVAVDSPFTVNQRCDGPKFTPTMEAGVQNPVAGASSPFTLHLARGDTDQEIESVTTQLPEGLLAKLAGITRCSDSQAAAGNCPATSRIGGVSAQAGAGPTPFSITTGHVFLTDGYKGAPFGLDITVPAVAGPFDLGVVNTRAALRIDPVTAQATVQADPLPRLLQGIPVLARDIRVGIDRPGFMLNPTDCTPTTIAATIGSFEGATADLSSRFQVGDCAALALKPKLAIALTGKGQSTDGKHPGVDAIVTQPAGQANLEKVTVSLPLSLALDPDNAQALCEFTDGSKVEPTCPKGSIVGTATARTPILDQPLTGPVYFVKNVRIDKKSGRQIKTLPKLVIPLTGENGVRLNLIGTSNVVDNRLVTTFDNIPDAPVSSFTLNITGGQHGILVVSNTDICKATQNADQQIDGQNGKTADTTIHLATPACGLTILSKTVGKRSVTLKISGLGPGKVTVTGKNIKKTSRTITAATVVASIVAKRTGHARPGQVKVTFTPAGTKKTITTTASLRKAAHVTTGEPK